MSRTRSRSGGVRNAGRNAVLAGLLTTAGLVLVLLGVADMRATGRSGSPWLALGLFPALLGPIGFVHFLSTARTVRDLRSGRTAFARWTLPADQFTRFRAEDARLVSEGSATNFYEPPRAVPPEGVEVIFGLDGVLIGDGYFPLSTSGGRRVSRVHEIMTNPQSIEFGMLLTTRVRTSSATMATQRTADTLRVPVAIGAERQAAEVVGRFRDRISRG